MLPKSQPIRSRSRICNGFCVCFTNTVGTEMQTQVCAWAWNRAMVRSLQSSAFSIIVISSPHSSFSFLLPSLSFSSFLLLQDFRRLQLSARDAGVPTLTANYPSEAWQETSRLTHPEGHDNLCAEVTVRTVRTGHHRENSECETQEMGRKAALRSPQCLNSLPWSSLDSLESERY